MRNNVFAAERGRFCCSSGSPVKPEFSPVVRDDGVIELVQTGEINTDEIIESYAQSCSLESILNRFKNGDQAALNVKVPMYLDLTQFPKTYAEILQLGIDAENRFNALPADVKREWNNNWREWLAQTGSEKWFKSFGIEKPVEDVKEEEVKNDES